jgi:CRISPR-associated protein Csm1
MTPPLDNSSEKRSEAVETAELALAGLLHDVGKLLERAHPPGAGLSPASENLASTLCPPDRDGRYSHRHVLYTREFFEWLEREAVFLPPGLNLYRVRDLACYHHRPATPEQKLITEADRLSAGLDREGQGEGHIRQTRMLSPLNTAAGRFDEEWRDAPRLDPVPFSAAAAYPQTDSAPDTDLTSKYARLQKEFEAAWAANQCPDPLGYVNRAAAVLEHFTWAVPSAVNARPDVSLFDHLKTTAALAVADRWAEDRARPFLLILGGLHGIQNHVLAVKEGQGGLAKRLRARSFQVAAYAESMALDLLCRLNLPLTQRLMQAGGKFTLLWPYNDRALDVIEEARPRLARWLYQRTGARLTLSLAAWVVSRKGMQNFFPGNLERARRHQNRERLREARDQLQTEGGWNEDGFLLPFKQPAPGQGLCPVCGLRPAGDGPADRPCRDCLDEQELGGRLPEARLAVFWPTKDRGAYETPAGSFSLLPAEAVLPADAALVGALDGYPLSAPASLSAAPLVSRPQVRGIPQGEGGPLEFDKLAAGDEAGDEKVRGRQALGCLKLDVDNLGLIFAPGDKNRFISRTAALSRSLEAFFSLGIKALIEAGEFRNRIYLLYAGGDDLAALGPWNLTFDFAARLRAEFRRYIGGGSELTLSAGLAVIPPHRPVTAALAEAEKLLESSKRAVGPGAIPLPLKNTPPGTPEKDRCGAFGLSLPWPDFEKALGEAKQLADWLGAGAVSVGQARRLLGYAEKFALFQKTRDTRYFEYAPLLNRDLTRNWREDSAEQRKAREWAAPLAHPNATEAMSRLGFVCRYALTANRRPGKEE